MKAQTISSTQAEIAAPGAHYQFIHIQNIDAAEDVYLKYDGDSATLTSSNGFKLAAGKSIFLNCDGSKGAHMFAGGVYGIRGGSSDVEIRVQGVAP